MSYKLRFHAQALREWQQLDGSVREPLKRKLAERLEQPRVPSAALHGLPDCYKIKLQSQGYRLVYCVDDAEVFVTVISTGKRDKNRVYRTAQNRLQEPTPPYP
jgi:mRNA interferase RelE/StbE